MIIRIHFNFSMLKAAAMKKQHVRTLHSPFILNAARGRKRP